MGDFMSPTDPIFYLHDANIDRLWDVWTRKQLKNGAPILPDGYLLPPPPPPQSNDYTRWSAEPFLFFCDANGKPVSKTRAGDYAEIGEFNYEYERGTGETLLEEEAAPAALEVSGAARSFSARVATPAEGAPNATTAVVEIPSSLLKQASEPEGPTLFAQVTIDPPPGDPTNKLWVFVDDGSNDSTPASPSFVGTLAMFGHHMSDSPFTFTIPMKAPLVSMRENKTLAVDEPLKLRVVPARQAGIQMEMAHEVAAATPRVVAITVSAL